MDKIDFFVEENMDVKKRPFKFFLEEDVARDFIGTVKSNNLYVRETLVKLMREFSSRYKDGRLLNEPERT